MSESTNMDYVREALTATVQVGNLANEMAKILLDFSHSESSNGESIDRDEFVSIVTLMNDLSDATNGLSFVVTNEEMLNKYNSHKDDAFDFSNAISMIAHQWRQPLSSINSMILNLQTKVLLGKHKVQDNTGHIDAEKTLQNFEQNVCDIFGRIEDLSVYMSDSVNEFKNLTDPHKKIDTVSAIDTIQKAVNVSKNSFRPYIVNESDNDEVTTIYGEFLNTLVCIVNNAYDAFSYTAIKAPKITITCSDTVDSLSVSVCDNAGGIPKDILSKIFDPYFSTKKENDGTGLGLFMAKTMIETHMGGKLTAENKNDGACFTIELPRKLKDK